MGWQDRLRLYLPEVEETMQALLTPHLQGADAHYAIMAYHLGWRDEQLRPAEAPPGKHVRPLLALLTCEAAGGAWQQAVPAAAALELLHNFSLIHDDIEDNSTTRRHRPTVWKLWGLPQAVNVGDGMFGLAYEALLRLPERGVSSERTLAAAKMFTETVRRLTEGQHLDMRFETEETVTQEAYLEMIGGKTAALLAISTGLGALIAGCKPECLEAYRRFGYHLGLAFQMEDDILGIWGDEARTGKSAASDILERKKTLPLLYALAQPEVASAVREIYHRETLSAEDTHQVLELLAQAGARDHTETQARSHHRAAMAALDETGIENNAQRDLRSLAQALLGRQS